ncbi:MAG TPA: phosphoribosylformylglycinamidine cyclo-ligase [bacterium]|nr:phosphoribosylformylglycinamidine cyclo-ligase [bacterium]
MAKSNLYKKAGVNIDEAMSALSKAKKLIKSTFNGNVAADIGSFGGVYRLSGGNYLVASTDGVGTKLKIAQSLNVHDTVGRDIVNHCVNDILVMGAKPLFFLDYFGTGKLDGSVLVEVIKGLSAACRENGCVLLGGETAEMPGIYKPGDYDLVGTIVGEAAPGRIITGKNVKRGDVIIGLGSDGLHTNGYSLARRVFESNGIPYTKHLKELGTTAGKALLKPHRSYFKSVYPLIRKKFKAVKAVAHITGGGFYDNIVRVLPENMRAVISGGSWKVLPVFKLIQKLGRIGDEEMHRVFNMGIGMVLIAGKKEAGSVARFLKAKGERVYNIGVVEKGKRSVEVVRKGR